MSRDLSYPYEKFVVAIYCLAGKASLQRRLEDVYMSCLIRLKPEDFEDQDMRSHFEGIMEHLTGDGPVRDTVMAMSDDKAESLAEQIIGLFFRIARAHLA
jgi:hypothetical protein